MMKELVEDVKQGRTKILSSQLLGMLLYVPELATSPFLAHTSTAKTTS